ncbi:phosphatase inhibitor 2 [Cryptosporidium sp. chipmunk genotype I]|uniref:phosphatase inhibitor 2 n=1 Tax=Cryptosporidium sp. chipmunk genotype I TaxID=1280935 RepID=UPI00351AAE41|nr:phosphatase inhibitor 2 [Cryptosporidium sp. chipmunk genotype I]
MSGKGKSGIDLKSEKNKAKISKRITWDEETIAMHDTERGTRMEINEPDTPYYYGSSNPSDDEEPYIKSSAKQKFAVDLNELSSRLFEHSNQIDDSFDDFSSSNFNDNTTSPIHKSKQDLFKEKRKVHYREFITAKSKLSKAKCFGSDSDSDSDFESNTGSDSEPYSNYKPKS